MSVISNKELNLSIESDGITFKISKAVLNNDGSVGFEISVNGSDRYAHFKNGNTLTFLGVRLGRRKIKGLTIDDGKVLSQIFNTVSNLNSEFEKMKQEDLGYIPDIVEIAGGRWSSKIYVFVNTPNGIEKPRVVRDIENKLNNLNLNVPDLLRSLCREGYAEMFIDPSDLFILWDYRVNFPQLVSKINGFLESNRKLMSGKLRARVGNIRVPKNLNQILTKS